METNNDTNAQEHAQECDAQRSVPPASNRGTGRGRGGAVRGLSGLGRSGRVSVSAQGTNDDTNNAQERDVQECDVQRSLQSASNRGRGTGRGCGGAVRGLSGLGRSGCVIGTNDDTINARERDAQESDVQRSMQSASNRGRGTGRGRGGVVRGGSGRGRSGRVSVQGRGRGRGGRAAISEHDRLIGKLPAALKPSIEDGGWEILSKRNSAAFDVITEEEYAEKYGSEKLRDAFLHIADSVSRHCTMYGKDNDNPSVFTTLFSHNAAVMIQTHTTEQLVKDGYEPLTVPEVYQFVGTILILSRLRIPTEETYQEYVPFIEEKHKIKLMTYERQLCMKVTLVLRDH